MEIIEFNDPMEGYGKNSWSINQKKYGQYFFMIFIELYHILYLDQNTNTLDIILKDMTEKFPKLNRGQTAWLENDIYTCYNISFSRIPHVIDSKYVEEFLNKKNNDANFQEYADNEFLAILEMIYNNVNLLQKYPTFTKGEFAHFMRRQPIIQHNNIAYLDCVNYIMDCLKDKPDFFELGKNNIIDLDKLEEVDNENVPYSLFIFGQWCDPYTFFKKVAELKIQSNDYFSSNLEFIQQQIPSFVIDFLYYTLFNSPSIEICSDEILFEVSQKLQFERLKEVGFDTMNQIFTFIDTNKDLFIKTFANTPILSIEFNILDNLKEIFFNAETHLRKLEYK